MLGKKNRILGMGMVGFVTTLATLVFSVGSQGAVQKLPKTLKSKKKSSPSGLDSGAVGESFEAVAGSGDLSVHEVPAQVVVAPIVTEEAKTKEPAPAMAPTEEPTAAQGVNETKRKLPKIGPVPNELGQFDVVPEGMEDALEERLALVEKLIKEHKRAYDYRTYTVRQLKEILEKLESETSS